MPRALTRVAGVLFAIGVPAGMLLAQQQQQPVFRARAELVQVDVAVVDTDGRPVHGLTKDDFTVLDRRTPQTIAFFEAFRFDAGKAAAASIAFPLTLKKDFTSNQTARASRLVVMVIDDLHLYKNRTERTKQIGRDVVRDLGPASSMAVLFTSGDRSVEVTEDAGALVGAIDRLEGRRPYPRPLPVVDQRGGDLQIFNDNMALLRTLKEAARTLAGGQQRRKAITSNSPDKSRANHSDTSHKRRRLRAPRRPVRLGVRRVSLSDEARLEVRQLREGPALAGPARAG